MPSETLRFWGFELKLQGALDVLLTKLYITSGQIGFRGFDGGIEDVDFFTAHADNRLSLMPLILQGHLVGIFWLVRNVVRMIFFFGGMF